jgi:hypothetical protein
MSRAVTRHVPEVVVEARGAVPERFIEYARRKVSALTAHVREPILHARVRLTRMPDPAVARPAIAQANLDVNGRLVRAQAVAVTEREAIDLLQERLRGRLDGISSHREARRGRMPRAGHERRHASEPARRPDHYPRVAEERRVVRRSAFALASETVDEAVSEMEQMGYDFHLFTDVDTGQDSVIYRAGLTGYRLGCLRPASPRHRTAVPVTRSQQPVPRLDVPAAVTRLELTGWPFVFFADVVTGRGALLYHRHDGHYGLLTPDRD